MPRGVPNEPLKKGAVYGCWTVLRETWPDPKGNQRYVVRASCCGVEKVKLYRDVLNASATCIRCRPQCRRGATT